MAAKAAAPASAFDSPEHQKAVEKFKKVNRRAAADANDAIAILERRARSATHDVELPGGDIVPIRERLSKAAMARCSALFGGIADAQAAGDTATVEARSNLLLGEILYVPDTEPAEIAEWLAANPESFSDMDAAEIVVAFGRMLRDENERMAKVINFRAE